MKKSIYNYVLQYRDGKHILFNTLNSSLIIFDEQHYNRYQSLNCSNENDAMVQVLASNGMIIDDSIDEKSIVDFDRGMTAYKKDRAFFRILTTTACNAKCPYCYEAGAKIETMSLDTAISVVDFIKRQTADIERFTIGWFGGEPLVNPKVIDYISSEMTKYAAETGKTWASTIITNGSLFNDELISKAASCWKIQNAQITLDGTKESYERIKGYADGTTFESVIHVIKELISSGIFVSIRLNYNDENYEDIQKLIRYLGTVLDHNQSNWAIYPYPLFDNTCNETNYTTVSCAVNLEAEISKLRPSFTSDAQSLPQYVSGRCGACSVNSCVILPNGDLIKCSRFINLGKPFGNVTSDKIEYNSDFTKWCAVTLPRKCESCVFLPICQGGCRAEQFMGKDGCTVKAKNIDKILISYADQHTSQ